MKQSLYLFSKQARSLTRAASNKWSLSLCLYSAITVFLVLSLYASTVLGQNTNTVLGINACPGSLRFSYGQNTAIGFHALFANTSGHYNSAIGYQVLYYNSTGKYNSACGMFALYSNTI
jgi:hypothetical protein